MAIVFTRPKRKNFSQIILGGIFVFLVIIFLFFLFKKGSEVVLPKQKVKIQPPQIKFENLENPLLKKLESYPAPEEFSGILGRDNPFVPAPPTSPTSIQSF